VGAVRVEIDDRNSEPGPMSGAVQSVGFCPSSRNVGPRVSIVSSWIRTGGPPFTPEKARKVTSGIWGSAGMRMANA
jgi:hypothetical protein